MSARRRLIGIVKSDRMTKTVVVEITRTFRHPLFEKVVHSRKKVKAHDELDCKIGDQVQIVESKPISREVRWVVESVLKKAVTPALSKEEVEEEVKVEVEEAEKGINDDSA